VNSKLQTSNFELRSQTVEAKTPAASSLLGSTGMPRELESFEKRSFRFACMVVKLFVELRSPYRVPYDVARQFLKAGTSIGANLEEAKGAESRHDARTKFSIALKEARETRYWLRLMIATSLVPTAVLATAERESGELVAILTAARKKLARRREQTTPPE